MRMFPVLAAAAALMTAAPVLAAQPVTGNWVTEDGDAVVNIGQCGKTLCGKIVKFLKTPPQGVDQRDVNNPDRSRRDRKILGLTVLSGFREDGSEWRGQIYDPKKGKTYRSLLQRQSGGKLEVKGCIGPFCQSQTWTRAN